MNANLIQRSKYHHANGIVEIVIWRVVEPIEPSMHYYKYRLVYVVGGVRQIGYDNERGKGDHCHHESIESPYQFVNVETLLLDFWSDVEKGGMK